MHDIFVNLKRFEVPRVMGGICPDEHPKAWIESVIDKCVQLGIGERCDIKLTLFLPEALIIAAIDKLQDYPKNQIQSLRIGCQGVYRDDIRLGENFGAFTTNLPATAASNLGCSWSLIGHSEERKDKLEIIQMYDSLLDKDIDKFFKAQLAVNRLINLELLRALEAGLNVLLCVGETAEEKGEGDFSEQRPRIVDVLRSQLLTSLEGVTDHQLSQQVVIGYEPVWAIGPGKTPPGAEYISFVSQQIKDIVKSEFGLEVPVVYGGGLKTENAPMLGNISTIDGGLIGLTKFTGQIGFEPVGLKEIIDEYVSSKE